MANRLTKGKALFGALQLSGGAVVKAINYGTLSVVHGTVLPNRMGTATAALSGLAAADILEMNPPAEPTAGLGFGGVNPAAGTATVFLVNPTTGTVSPGTIAFTYAHIDLT